MKFQNLDNARAWIEFFEEHVTEEGGPLEIQATFEAKPEGTWQLVCSRNLGTIVVDPNGVEHDADALLKEHA